MLENPVSRSLAVTDLDQSISFYRDVLGFELKPESTPAELVLGPVELRLESTNDRRTTILFLQTDDVAALHFTLQTRGTTPSEIVKVNWIQMSMFEIRDPDGNVLWFGQTYHKEQGNPSHRDGQPRGLRQALPELPFGNVSAAVTYYCEILGFRINYQQEDLGVLDRDAITILLIPRTANHQGTASLSAYVENADQLHAELLAKGARVQGPPVSHPWGLRDFQVLDLEGNRITFAQTFE
jgi:uncharacterized glyoxalase superfamily protein PhnB